MGCLQTARSAPKTTSQVQGHVQYSLTATNNTPQTQPQITYPTMPMTTAQPNKVEEKEVKCICGSKMQLIRDGANACMQSDCAVQNKSIYNKIKMYQCSNKNTLKHMTFDRNDIGYKVCLECTEKDEFKYFDQFQENELKKRKIMNITELESFCDKKHDQRVHKLLSDNIDLLFAKPTYYYQQIFANCKEILKIEENTKYYDYYAFFVVDFLFHDCSHDVSTHDTYYKHKAWFYLFEFLEPLIQKVVKNEFMPRISTASIYGMEACLLVDTRLYGNDTILPQCLMNQYFGYDFTNSKSNTSLKIDARRAYLDLIEKGLKINPNDTYCAWALNLHYTENKIWNKAKYWGIKSGLLARPFCQSCATRVLQQFEHDNILLQQKIEAYEELKAKYESGELTQYNREDIKAFKAIANFYALNDDYKQGLAVFDDIERSSVILSKSKQLNVGFRIWNIWRLEYILNYGKDWDSLAQSNAMFKDEFNKVYTFYYLPDYMRDDPICANDLLPNKQSQKYSAEWLVSDDYKYDKEAGDKCKTHSFLYSYCDVSEKNKILNEWAEDEEYNIKWKYSLNELLDIIYDGLHQLNEDNIDIIFQDKNKHGDDIPLFWDCLLSVWYVMISKHGFAYGDTQHHPNNLGGLQPLIVTQYKLNLLSKIFEQLKPIFYYIGKHGGLDRNIDKIFNKLQQLWDKNSMVNIYQIEMKGTEFYHKMISLMVDAATSTSKYDNNDDEKKHNYEKKQFEGQVKILQFLNNTKRRKIYNKYYQYGWMNDSRSGIKRNEIMENIKQKYQNKLDNLGLVLMDYYNNELFANPNYNKLIGNIVNPLNEELILRQDKKSVLGRCRWGPLENDQINEQRYKQDLKTKYELIPINNLNIEPISNSFKNAYVDFVLKIGETLQISFQKDMKELFSNTNGEYFEAPIKKFQRCLQKIDYDYKEEKQPVGAHILDIVRCLVVYENIKDLVDAYNLLSSKYKVCRLKNNFIKNAKVFGNYRCLMVNILYKHPKNENIKMIVEVQLTLRKVYLVRLTMHKTYKLFRAVLPQDDAMLF